MGDPRPARRHGRGLRALAEQGAHAAASGERSAIACPFCGSVQTELFSLFGSSLLTSQYYCRDCRSVFERVKWGDAPPA